MQAVSEQNPQNNLENLSEQMRDIYLVYKEAAAKCQVELKSNQASEQQKGKCYYFPPRIPFLDDPERQKQFRRDFISEVTTSPEPEHLRLLSDELHKEVLLAIGDRSKPDVTREELSQFFKRRIA